MRSLPPRALASLLSVLALVSSARADVGLWLFSSPPREQLRKVHQFELTDAWLDHVMKSSIKFGGGSASFVSADGLLITNHHVGRSTLQRISPEGRDYARDGFHARTPAEEIKCPDLAVTVLQSTEDVTARVNAAVPAGATADAAVLARRQVMNEIEKESQDKTGGQSLVITLYQGGQYHLYRYQRYTDVRLVFSPEFAIAHYGGDVDNFEYPRYCLDVCFFRVYENGAPARLAHFLKWSANGVKEGDLVLVSGHPSSTDRRLTAVEVEFQRDVTAPFLLSDLMQTEVLLTNWAARSQENARRAARVLPSLQNNRKRQGGILSALQDPAVLARKRAEEAELKRALAARYDTAAVAAFDAIADATKSLRAGYTRYLSLESGFGFASDSYTIARHLLRAGDERAKPNGERLRAYAEARLPALQVPLFSPAPIYEDLEIIRLGGSLTRLVALLGAEDPLAQKLLAGKSPAARATEVIRGTQVRDVAFRRKLYEGGAAAVAAAGDPLIELARIVDGEARAITRVMELGGETLRRAHATIAQARFALHGAAEYPDATGTLRLAYGVVKGTAGPDAVPAFTHVAGLYERSAAQRGREPFNLPPRWQEAERKGALDRGLTFDFIDTSDTHGGNSGSPKLNRAGEFVGIQFDGNLGTLGSGLAYDDVRARSIGVHSPIILAALRQVYDAGGLADELTQGGLAPSGSVTRSR